MSAAHEQIDQEVHMTGGHSPPSRKPATYEIRIRGRLDEDWVEWFDDMTLAHTGKGDTLLTGPVPDQAALHGLLNKIRNLNLDLISVTQVGANASNASAPGQGGAHAE